MADMERMHFIDRLPPARNWRSTAARKQALKIASNLGKWGKLAQYPATEEGANAAHQRAYATPRTDTFRSVGTFQGAARYDADEDQWVVWIKCVRRNSDGQVAADE